MGACKICNDKGRFKDRCDCGGDEDCYDCDGEGYVWKNCYSCNPAKVESYSHKKHNYWWWIGGIVAGLVIIGLIDPSTNDVVNAVSSQYEVLSVYKGAVQVKDIQTGEVVQIFNNDLVKKALEGIIKRGDLIKFLN